MCAVGGRGHHARATLWLSKEHQHPLGYRMLLVEGGGGCRYPSPAPQQLLQMVEILLACVSSVSVAACGEGQGWHS